MAYRASIIGCGRVAWMLEDDPLREKPCTHAGAYMALRVEGKVELSAAADIDLERLKAFTGRFNAVSSYVDYKEMLLEEAPDIVSICAYSSDRYAMAMDSIEAGVKGIWCEKAFASSIDEGRRMMESCDESGVTLIVSHMRRWSARYELAKKMVDEGMIGVPLSAVSHFSGSLLHTGTHAFDVLRWYFGPVEWVEGRLEGGPVNPVHENFGDPGGRAVIQFENGAYATVHAESKQYFSFEFDIIGSRGRIRIGNGLLEYYAPKESKFYSGIEDLQKEEPPAFEKRNVWAAALSNLIGCMEGREANLSAPREGLDALEIALAIHESARRDGGRVYMPLKSGLKVRSI